MPIYYFNVNDGHCVLADTDGTDLSDDVAAHQHAIQVARELMRNGKGLVRNWRIQVCDCDRQPFLELLFASVDDRLDILSSDIRSSVERLCGNMATLSDSIQSVRMNLRRLRATLAHAERMPYIAAVHGERVDPAV